ncbi:MAG: hypothetical protein FJ405_08470, partial [Verrucomicrobia bacterium]|nr:hypothetical protein [Verrucomicrobiota bacterium]
MLLPGSHFPVPALNRSVVLLCLCLLPLFQLQSQQPSTRLQAGAAAAELQADDSMIIAGGITGYQLQGQEGKLRCVAVVLALGPQKLAIVACDVLMMTRQVLDPVIAEIESATGISRSNVLINCTHTHHAPSTMRVHDYAPDTVFTRRVQEGIVAAVKSAASKLGDADFLFALGEEKTV